ncbi:MAG TPA: hypothetical protein VF789_32220 [Thermoanaerobaculia bacterium]
MKIRVAVTSVLMLVLGLSGMLSTASAAGPSAVVKITCPCPAPACYPLSNGMCICDLRLCPCVSSTRPCSPE